MEMEEYDQLGNIKEGDKSGWDHQPALKEISLI